MLLTSGMMHQVWQLGDEQLLHGQPDGIGGTRQTEDENATDAPGHGTAKHGGRADLFVAQNTKHLAKTGQWDVQQWLDRLGRLISWGNAGSTGRKNDVQIRYRAQLAHGRADVRRIVGHDSAIQQAMPGTVHRVNDQLTAGIGVDGPRVTDRQYRITQLLRRVLAMLLRALGHLVSYFPRMIEGRTHHS